VPGQRHAIGGRQVVAQERRHGREHLNVNPGSRLRRQPTLCLEEHIPGPEPHGAENQHAVGALLDRLHLREARGRAGRIIARQQVAMGVDEHGTASG
jgi:hypothetical protein